jgi:lipid-A-disaccharide synthase-like uncharacterized protein
VLENIQNWWASHSPTDIVWLTIGLIGQAMFSVRWIAQWIASEKMKQSTVPESFWYLSFTGGLMVLCYGIYKIDPVIILGQFGLFIYARNLLFIMKSKQDKRPPFA